GVASVFLQYVKKVKSYSNRPHPPQSLRTFPVGSRKRHLRVPAFRRERTGTCEARPEGRASGMRQVAASPRDAVPLRSRVRGGPSPAGPPRSSRCASPCRFAPEGERALVALLS